MLGGAVFNAKLYIMLNYEWDENKDEKRRFCNVTITMQEQVTLKLKLSWMRKKKFTKIVISLIGQKFLFPFTFLISF